MCMYVHVCMTYVHAHAHVHAHVLSEHGGERSSVSTLCHTQDHSLLSLESKVGGRKR